MVRGYCLVSVHDRAAGRGSPRRKVIKQALRVLLRIGCALLAAFLLMAARLAPSTWTPDAPPALFWGRLIGEALDIGLGTLSLWLAVRPKAKRKA
jgi:hypothetical protein